MNARCTIVLLATLLPGCAKPSAEQCLETARVGMYRASLRPEVRRQPLTPLDVRLDRVEPSVVLPGTQVRIFGDNLAGEPVSLPEARLEGEMWPADGSDGRTLSLPLPVTPAEDGSGLVAEMTDGLIRSFGHGEGVFEGLVHVRTYVGDPLTPVDLSVSWHVTLQENLFPRLNEFNLGAADVWPADRVVVDGEGFLYPEEGSTLVKLTGEYVPEDGGAAYPVSTLRALTPTSGRDTGTLLLGPDVLGPEPGELRNGSVTLLNSTRGGLERQSPDHVPVSLRVNRPFISGLSPEAPCRGQRVRLLGRGFLPGGHTLLRLDGDFQPVGRGGPAPDPTPLRDYIITPDRWLDGGTIEVALLTQYADDGSLAGFSASPGLFSGTITPVLATDRGEVEGLPYDGGLEIGATRQVVWVRFLPTLSDALREYFGLETVEDRIRRRVLEVAARDYEGFNIEFSDTKPEDYIEFSIIEVGGPDPNQVGLFGLDNTEGKDTGNLRLNDIVGGENAASGEQGYYVFGGVFIESFLHFSPQVTNPLPIASDHFDQVLVQFAPFLCGEPIRVSDLGGGPRTAAIDEAVRVMGNIIGGTVVHEIGHSLGLTQALPGPTDFHNMGDNGYIMDAGAERSYEERAEIEGLVPAWHPLNKQYLHKVLPPPKGR